MNLAKRIFAFLVCGTLSLSALAFVPQLSFETNAASFSDINSSSVFVKQQTSVTCTLAANVMMLRRTAMMRGDSDWSSITESSCRPVLWYEGEGMWHNYTYKNITVNYQYLSKSSSISSQLINALKEHPEGIAVYDTDYPHAILLTDYTDGVFYCADPANNVASGRIPVSKSLISISNVDTYWYVSSPNVSLNNNASNNTQYRITSSNGVNLRSNAGTSYNIIGSIPYNTTVTVTNKKSADGYTWGYTKYNGVSGWFALDYAVAVSSNGKLANKSTVSSTSITLGNSVLLTGIGTGGTSDYNYAFYYKKSNDSKWTALKGFSDIKTKVFKPTSTGTYDICIKVQDSTGSTEKKYFNLNVGSANLTNTSKISDSSVTLGNSILLDASATGSSNYTYAYYYKKSSDSKWTALKDFTSNSSKVFKPDSTGTYDICIKVKDGNENISNQYFSLTVYSSDFINTSKLSSSSVTLGNSIMLTASATGGSSGYTYAYYYKKSNDSKWTALKGFSSANTTTFKPDSTGTYDICIKVQDKNENIAKQYMSVTVSSEGLVNTSKISSSNITLGKSITLTASATGGSSGYTYAYYYKKSSDNKWTALKGYTANTTVKFQPSESTRYNICVYAKDSNGTIAKQYYMLNVK